MLLQRAKQQAQDELEPQDNPQEESAEPQQAGSSQQPSEQPGESQEDPQEESSETPDQESQEGQSGDDGSDDLPEGEPASPEDEAELKRALGAFAAAVYKDDNTFNSIVQKLKNPDIPPINKLSDTTISLVTQIDKKINIDEGVVLPFTATVYDKIYEIAQTAKAFTLPDDLMKKGLMVTLQLTIQAYGVSPEEYNDFCEHIGEHGAKKVINFYQKNGGGIQNGQSAG